MDYYEKTAPTAGYNIQVVRTNYHKTIRMSAHTLMGAKILLIYYAAIFQRIKLFFSF